MVKRLANNGELPFQWVLGDETYGSDLKFLDGVAAAGKFYHVEVPKTTQVYLRLAELHLAEGQADARPSSVGFEERVLPLCLDARRHDQQSA